jgi:hypothetical protein
MVVALQRLSSRLVLLPVARFLDSESSLAESDLHLITAGVCSES